jgi:hypothetical protein
MAQACFVPPCSAVPAVQHSTMPACDAALLTCPRVLNVPHAGARVSAIPTFWPLRMAFLGSNAKRSASPRCSCLFVSPGVEQNLDRLCSALALKKRRNPQKDAFHSALLPKGAILEWPLEEATKSLLSAGADKEAKSPKRMLPTLLRCCPRGPF